MEMDLDLIKFRLSLEKTN